MKITQANNRGGKAGKGLNKTSTFRVMDEENCIIKQFRYTVGDGKSMERALKAAQEYMMQKKAL